ncbi:MAG: YigZ family protein [Anaerolineales bacterium]|nr:YigZ family protein [Anaerolineales bacterium]
MPFNYDVPLTRVRRECEVKKSRFIATLAPALSIDEARHFLADVKREFADATHNVSAYIIGGGNTVTEYFSDDGEPAGTAGKPALTVLRGSGLGDVALTITRYFGGNLLGSGGLVKAYTEAAQLATLAVARGRRIPVHVGRVMIPYNLLERVRLLAARCQGVILEENFAGEITLTLQFPVTDFEAFQAELRELSAGKLKVEIMETKETLVRL